MNMTERALGSVTIIDLDGKLNLGDATTRLHDKINSLLLQGCKHLVLNLAAVTAVDSGG
jgi:hypothetical protein